MRDLVSTFNASIRPWAIATKMTVRAKPEGTSRVIMTPAHMRPISVFVKEDPMRSMLWSAIRLPNPVRFSTCAIMRAEKHIHCRKVHQLENATAGFVTNRAYRNVRMAAMTADGRTSMAHAITAHSVIAKKKRCVGTGYLHFWSSEKDDCRQSETESPLPPVALNHNNLQEYLS